MDAADYVLWRKNAGTSNSLQNDPIGGHIGQAQYDQWRQNFGASGSGSAFSAAAVPEPASLVLFMLARLCTATARRRRCV